jgi:membrane-associated protein
MLHSILNAIDPITIIKTLGLIGVFFIIFAESGLFFGFFFPGDSLLFTAGLFASLGFLNPTLLIWGAFVFAVLGDSFGYWFGKRIGSKLFTKEDSLFFQKKHVERAQKFYEKYGNKTIILARFIPIVRTLAPIVAGVGQMNYIKFVKYNLIGGFIWSFGMVLAGFTLGSVIPNVDKYLLPIIILLIGISFIPVFVEFYKSKRG